MDDARPWAESARIVIERPLRSGVASPSHRPPTTPAAGHSGSEAARWGTGPRIRRDDPQLPLKGVLIVELDTFNGSSLRGPPWNSPSQHVAK